LDLQPESSGFLLTPSELQLGPRGSRLRDQRIVPEGRRPNRPTPADYRERTSRAWRAGIIHLAKEQLNSCDGSQTPKRRADIDRLLTKLEAADGIVFGTPTYWFNMSALMKNLLERLTVTEQGWTLEGRVAGFVATGSKQEDGAMIGLSSLAATVNHLGMVTFPYSMIYFRGASGPD
jgi:hypothetical protein